MVTYFPQPSYDRALFEVILIFGRYFYRERPEDSLNIRRVHRYLGETEERKDSENVYPDE